MRLSRCKSGSILVLVIWSLTVLAVFAVFLGYASQSRIKFNRRMQWRDKLRFVSQSGVYDVIARVLKQEKVSENLLFSCLVDGFVNRSSVLLGKTSDKPFLLLYNYIISLSGSNAYSLLIDEERRLNINYASLSQIKQLLVKTAGASEETAAEIARLILDWRDADNDTSLALSADKEDIEYRMAGFKYPPKNSAFQLKNELLLVKGMDQALYDKIAPYITVYGNGAVNVNTADPLVLSCLGFDDKAVDKIVLFRKDPGSDGIFSSLDQFMLKLQESGVLNDEAQARLQELIKNGALGVESDTFDIHTVGMTAGSGMYLFLNGVFGREGNILYWHEEFRN